MTISRFFNSVAKTRTSGRSSGNSIIGGIGRYLQKKVWLPSACHNFNYSPRPQHLGTSPAITREPEIRGCNMNRRDVDNLALIESTVSVDKLNARFYGRFPYPWLPGKFDYLDDPDFEPVMLGQDLGYWNHRVLPENPKIWVAGCGTNQAVFTALKFPKATILGSDVSSKSLEVCAETAKQLGISNLELRQESINNVRYQEEFDYIVCTGVIHHNADPSATLDRLAAAIKNSGIIELMVYNYFHWIIPYAFQQAIKILGDQIRGVDFEADLSLALKLIDELPNNNLLGVFLRNYKNCDESMLADTLIQPVLSSYTVESFEELVTTSGLEILTPHISKFDKVSERLSWNMNFKETVLKETYNLLPDTRRWHLSNLFMLENSPMLWFYTQRKDGTRKRKSERQICEDFLNQKFVKAKTTQRNYTQNKDGSYSLSPKPLPFPSAPPDNIVKKIIDEVDGQTPMSDIFKRLDLGVDFETINQIRIILATSAFPYLRAV
jgi:SAM-dependent methyltransferase